MNRRNFLSFLGIGAAEAVVAPKLLASEPRKSYEDNLTVFEEPRAGYDYSIGVYNGDGLGGSPSCISVMRIGKKDEPCVQAAEFISVHHNPAQIVPIIAHIASKYGEKCIDPRGPMIIIEQVSAPGDVTQNQLKIMGFTRFFKVASITIDMQGLGDRERFQECTGFSGSDDLRQGLEQIASISTKGSLVLQRRR